MEREKRHRLPPKRSERANNLRFDSTFPERLLWSRLRNKRLAGLKFRRQHVIEPFVVVFYCAEAQLVVELDGRSHEGRSESDQRRSASLEQQGLRVVRFSNDDVLDDVDAVAEMIARLAGWSEDIGCRAEQAPNAVTLPQPLPKREGGEGDRHANSPPSEGGVRRG